MKSGTSRRDFIKKTGMVLAMPGLAEIYHPGFFYNGSEESGLLKAGREDYHLYFRLLTRWCDALINLQVTDRTFPGLYGGILCPACSRVHGRIGDAVYPFMRMASLTGKRKYIDAAVRVMEWSENNVSFPDGSWVNDVNVNLWKGITVFSSIALAETLKFHGHLLGSHIRQKWTERLRKACEFLMGFITIDTSNINYPLCCSYALALGGKLLNEDRFIDRARDLVSQGMEYFTKENSFIFGECKPRTASPKGCLPVDLAYNVEETLPCLTHYAFLMEDQPLRERLIKTWETHLEFMLPDGAWDDSFGTRNHKWSYWGSRNSDGCQAGLLLFSEESALFAEAAYRNALLLEKCTVDGILYGGPHYVSHKVQPCIHHNFAHAKSLASVLDHGSSFEGEFERCALPAEKGSRMKYFPEIDTWIISKGDWRATITGNDCEYPESPHATGGSISLLHHRQLGLILTDSLAESKMREAANMQMNTDPVQRTVVPGIEMERGGILYRSSRYRSAVITGEETGGDFVVRVKTRLVDFDHNDPASGSVSCELVYSFTENSVRIEAEISEKVTGYDSLVFVLPIVSPGYEKVDFNSPGSMVIEKANGILKVSSVIPLSVPQMEQERIFSHSPGVEAIPVLLKWDTLQVRRLKVDISMAL
jgi:hypothetical protein